MTIAFYITIIDCTITFQMNLSNIILMNIKYENELFKTYIIQKRNFLITLRMHNNIKNAMQIMLSMPLILGNLVWITAFRNISFCVKYDKLHLAYILGLRDFHSCTRPPNEFAISLSNSAVSIFIQISLKMTYLTVTCKEKTACFFIYLLIKVTSLVLHFMICALT
jgi:hypothetical protein